MILLIQKLINKFYRYPKSKTKEIIRFGGKKPYREMLQGKKTMMEQVKQLEPVYSVLDGFDIYFLTGKNYLYQTLFCISSLDQQAPSTFRYNIVDDGSFDEELIQMVIDKLPNSKIVLKEEIEQNLRELIPEFQFPILHQKRKVYPHIKKLTDIHTLTSDSAYKLVLDSDMLFWNQPKEIIDWFYHTEHPIHMVDCAEAYGYSHQLMRNLCGHEIPSMVNVGVIGMDSATINWELLEEWIKQLEAQEGTCYYLEQALSAMLIAGKTATVLDEVSYKVNPLSGEIEETKAILHHYVDLSKMGYYTRAWKKFV
jgi:hypothetical protein